ncbi:MAG: glycoside hydrolase, partial [Lachnospiraceae bacterium]|nr:glycoside hydrolase [Lachnospiraceae bacterium]
AGMVMMGGHYAYLAVRVIEGEKTLVYAEAYDAEDGSMKEKMNVLQKLAEDTDQVVFSFAMEEGKEGPVFKMFYTLADGQEVNVPTDFMPSDHTWVGAKIGLFANVLAENSTGGYADFEYIHVTSLTEGN